MDQKIYAYSPLEDEKIAIALNSSLTQGLNSKDAATRLRLEGGNELGRQQIYWWQILLRQLKSPFIYLLFLAAGLAFFLNEILDAGMIALFILINSFLGFYQEYKSEQALKLLNQYTKSTAKIIRDGRQMVIASSELVRGDLVVLETGDLVPADIRLLGKTDVAIDETVLTGESITVHKNGLSMTRTPKDIYEASNLAFTGTTVVAGSSRGLVVAAGKQTAFGQIKELTTEIAKESAFTKGIARFSSFILKLTVITLIFVFLANIAIKGENANIPELLIFAIALAVSVIPEALPVVTTLSLSRGALRLAKQKVISKRLSAVEDLGSIEVLCADKTGTITENQLAVSQCLPADKETNLVLLANLAGAYFKESLEPFDVALKNSLTDKKQLLTFTQLGARPFDPVRRSNAVTVKNRAGVCTLILRGAPEEITKLCNNLNARQKKMFSKWLSFEGRQGHRLMALAVKEINREEITKDISILEKDLNFAGCISFVDPIKNSAYNAVKKAKKLGVSLKIITGDSLDVAFAVAKEIDLADKKSQAVLASDFIALPEQEQKKLLPTISVFARTDPEQKHYLVKLLQENFEVGFVGEGINDSPALKAAGVSIVVQSASDIAREAADIILLKKDLSVIIDGIEEGRIIFANTVKYLKATLASNFGNFYAVAIGSLFIDFLPMLPIQLLLVNLLSDFPMISIAADSVDAAETLAPKKYNAKDLVLIATILGVVSTVFDFMFFGFFYKISPGVLQTNWFMGSILTELVFLFSIRTRLPFYRAAFPSKAVLLLTGGAFITTIALPFTVIGQNIFRFTRPSYTHLTLILGLVGAYFICSEIVKNVYYKTWLKK